MEVLVSLGLITVVMAAVTPVMVSSLRLTDQQRSRQVAVQLAGDAMERVRSLPVKDVPTLDGIETRTVAGVDYRQRWSVETCKQTGEYELQCQPASEDQADFLRVEVTVTWESARCPAHGCSYATATLVSSAPDPEFSL